MTREQIIQEASKYIAKVPFPIDDRLIEIPVLDIHDRRGLFYLVSFIKKPVRVMTSGGYLKEWYTWEVLSIRK